MEREGGREEKREGGREGGKEGGRKGGKERERGREGVTRIKFPSCEQIRTH